MAETNNAADANGQPAVVMERVFAAPPETVWRAWTDPALLARWYKPNAGCETAVLQHDLRPGGMLHYRMVFGPMPPHHERWEFEEVVAPTRLRWRQMLADADANVIGNARMPDWPRVMMTTIELQAHPQGTLQRMTWAPWQATEAEIACFKAASANPQMGWTGGFNNLAELCRELGAT